MRKMTFLDVPVGAIFLFENKGLRKVEEQAVGSDKINAVTVNGNGEAWFFEPTDIVNVMEATLKTEPTGV